MKGIKQCVIAGIFIFTSATGIAATNNTNTTNTTNTANTTAHTAMNANWMCTTNASSSSMPKDKAADDKMANHLSSAAAAFAFAASHCRDCTKITCEQQNR